MAKKTIFLQLLVALFLAIILPVSYLSTIGKIFSDATYDYMVNKHPPLGTEDIVIVGIDETSIQKYGRMPWPRAYMGALAYYLEDKGAKSIVYDFLFLDPDDYAYDGPNRNDELFAQALREISACSALATTVRPNFNVLTPLSIFETSSNIGHINIASSSDGVVRSIPSIYKTERKDKDGKLLEKNTLNPLSIEAFCPSFTYTPKLYRDGTSNLTVIIPLKDNMTDKIYIPLERNFKINIYPSPPQTENFIPAWKLLSNEIKNPEIFKDKIVFIGIAAAGYGDYHKTAVGYKYGVDIHADIATQIINKQFISKYIPYEVLMLCILVLSILPLFLNTLLYTTITTATIGGWFYASNWAFIEHLYIVDPIISSISLVLIYFLGLILINQRLKKKADTESLKARHDALTGLANRAGFDIAINEATKSANIKSSTALFMIDLDGFKAINDTHGHAAGDETLVEVSKRLKSCFRQNDLVCRLGGDEFAIIVYRVNQQLASKLASKVIKEVQQPIKTEPAIVNVGCSIGIALFPNQTKNKAELVEMADMAMYDVKKSGKNAFKLYSKKPT
jgi:diguanylate cyclase (GGDEF)-like protein